MDPRVNRSRLYHEAAFCMKSLVLFRMRDMKIGEVTLPAPFAAKIDGEPVQVSQVMTTRKGDVRVKFSNRKTDWMSVELLDDRLDVCRKIKEIVG